MNERALPVVAARSLFISHGAPTLALDNSPAGQFLDQLGPRLQRPTAVIVVSAHYSTSIPAIGGGARPATVHDFGGFPPSLYAIEYPARGDPLLARHIHQALSDAGVVNQLDAERGLDHGAWVPMLRMFPDADIPIIPMSVMPRSDAATHYRLGRALADVLPDDVLLIGSGGSVHNLTDLHWNGSGAATSSWASGFAHWLLDRLAVGDVEGLLNWKNRAPQADRAHPSPEHLLPLFVALGAAGSDATTTVLQDEFSMGNLGMHCLAFHR